jgi:hypothetical protein
MKFKPLNVIVFSYFSLVAGVVDRGIVTEKINGKIKKIKKLIKKLIKKVKKTAIVRKKIKRKDSLISRHLVKKNLKIV